MVNTIINKLRIFSIIFIHKRNREIRRSTNPQIRKSTNNLVNPSMDIYDKYISDINNVDVCGDNLRDIDDQCDDICFIAINNDWAAIQYVKKQSHNICVFAINK